MGKSASVRPSTRSKGGGGHGSMEAGRVLQSVGHPISCELFK
jgi:hypothetical protein